MSALPLPEMPGDWARDALCAQVGGDEWFPEKGSSSREARAVCARCPVRNECLAFALEHDERFGMWGGLTPRERRRLTKGRPAGPSQRDLTARKIRTLIAQGRSDPEVAVWLGISDKTVQRIRRDYGIEPHPDYAQHANGAPRD